MAGGEGAAGRVAGVVEEGVVELGSGEAVDGLQDQHAAQQGQALRVVHHGPQRLRAVRRRRAIEPSGSQLGEALTVGDEGDRVGRVRVGRGGREHLMGNLLLKAYLNAQ